jgi:hypothetical protein
MEGRAMIESKTVAEDLASPAQFDSWKLLRHCAEWLATDIEQDRLSHRWAELETQLERRYGWLRLSLAERQAIPEAAELFGLEASLDRLSQDRDATLEAIGGLKADDAATVTAKLAIAARLLRDDGGPSYRIVADIVRALSAGCGRPKAAPARRST